MATEKRLISLDEAIARVKDDGILGEGYSDDERIDDVCDILESCEIVDAVEVVRCKDCKSYMAETEERCIALKANPFGWCLRQRRLREADHREIRDANDFCSYGERKDNERKAD